MKASPTPGYSQPKPWTEASGSGMHVHTSLLADGESIAPMVNRLTT